MLNNTDINIRVALDALQDVQAATATITFERIRRAGNLLQFLQNKLRDDERPLQKSRFPNVRNPAINDYTSVHNLRTPSPAPSEAELALVKATQFRSFPEPDQETKIRTDSIQQERQDLRYNHILQRYLPEQQVA